MEENEVRILSRRSDGCFPVEFFDDGDVDIAVFVATPQGLERLLGSRANPSRGRVRLLTYCGPESLRTYCEEHGIQLKSYARDSAPLMHMKAYMRVDERVLVFGSANLTAAALQWNVEIVSRGNEAGFDAVSSWFAGSWSAARAFEPRQQWIPRVAREPEEVLRGEILGLKDGVVQRELHAYQAKVVEEINQWLKGPVFGLGRIARLPTGAGKTLIAAEVVRQFLEVDSERRVMWTCNTVQPLVQAAVCFLRQTGGRVRISIGTAPTCDLTKRFGEQFAELLEGLAFSGCVVDERNAQVVFGTYGMLGDSRYTPDECWSNVGLLVVDEAHRFSRKGAGGNLNKRVGRLIKRREGGLAGLPMLGLTATPNQDRVHHKSRLWDDSEFFGSQIEPKWLLDEGYLARTEGSYRVDAGLFDFHESAEKMSKLLEGRIREFGTPERSEVVWAELCRLPEKLPRVRRVLLFCVTIEQVKWFCARAGVGFELRAIHSENGVVENSKSLNWFEDSSESLKVLASVMMAAEGVDLPKIDCVFFARPTLSPILHAQMEGRGLRGPQMGGTINCIFVDFVYQFVKSHDGVVERGESVVAPCNVTQDSNQNAWEDRE